jgi:FkbM family methyltransferase
MSMISYAQNQEDVLLRRAFPNVKDGFYIDAGANDPVVDSVTKYFYDQGWRGINIEPGQASYERLRDDRKEDVNLNVGLSNYETTSELIEFPSNPGLSTFSTDLADVWARKGLDATKRSVPLMTLAQVCQVYVDRTIDFLKIDVEGHEREVIEGGNWEKWRPRVIVVEATWRPKQWEHLILDADYLFAIFDGLNRYYVRAEDSQLLSVLNIPVNVTDDYVPARHICAIERRDRMIDDLSTRLGDLSTRLGSCVDLGPNAINVARRLHHMAARYRQLSSEVRRIARLGA